LSERLLVNHFYAQQVGHAVEALHYANGHHAADPDLRIAVALNRATATELAALCPAVDACYAIDHPFLEPCGDSAARLAASGLPREWDWICDDPRRHQSWQLELFPGMRDFYATSDAWLNARRARTIEGAIGRAPYVPHTPLRLQVPEAERERAAARVGAGDGPLVALMPAGSSPAELYPSVSAWLTILDALAEALPGVRVVLIGRSVRDERSATSIDPAGHARLLAHHTRPIDCFDVALVEQLAVVERSAFFLSPHTGFGLVALAVATPWLTISGGRWFEYWFNHVPFRSILPPDPERFPVMSDARIADDLPRIVAAAQELAGGTLTYEQALADYFPALLAAHGGDASAIWSIDGVHASYA
jgi:ADP-heptose:LPS heptosyltransferase